VNSEKFIKGFIILIRKSLLTSLYQREGYSPSLAKRGKGRFFIKCLFYYINNFSLFTFNVELLWR